MMDLTAELAKAIGLPPRSTKAVLTLEVGKMPTLEVTCHPTDSAGHLIVERVPGEYGEGLVRRFAQVQFMLRLERFPPLNKKPK
jgi:hypothetical protein